MQLHVGVKMTCQASSEYLCHHDEGKIFQLRPDILLSDPDRRWVLDTKWKLIDQSDRANKYGISQADMYQLFAYGHKYVAGQGDVFLLYPSWKKFTKELPVFKYSERLHLRAIPFDLTSDRLISDDVPFLSNVGRSLLDDEVVS
jgi:5-methylcytosine-specific restriction enzyme subunit McrC